MGLPPALTEADEEGFEPKPNHVRNGIYPQLRDPPARASLHFPHQADTTAQHHRLVPFDESLRRGRGSRRQSPSTGWNRDASSTSITSVRLRQLSVSPSPPRRERRQRHEIRQQQDLALKAQKRWSPVRLLASAKVSTRNGIVNFWRKNKGLVLVFVSQFFGTLMNVTTRILEIDGGNGKGMHPFQILFARMSITFVLASSYMWWKKTEHFPFGMKEVRMLLIARGFGGFFGVFGLYYSLRYLPLADATVITFLAPSLACWACSFLINEPFTRMEQIAAYVSLFGVVLIARPTSFFPSSTSPLKSGRSLDALPLSNNGTANIQNSGDSNDVTPSQRAGAVAVAMLGVLGAASAYTTIRWIGKRAHPLLSVNYFAAWCTIVSTTMVLTVPSIGFLLPANIREWFLLVFLGLCGFIMQFLLAAGLQQEKSSRATNMVYSQMLFALAFDKIIWDSTPGVLSIVGSALILGSAIYVAILKDRSKSREELGHGNADEEQVLVGSFEEDSGNENDDSVEQVIQLRAIRA